MQLRQESGLRSLGLLVKQIMDLIGAAILFVLLFPLNLVLAIWIKLDSPGSVLFRQIRVGRFHKPFMIFKFRTMVTGSEKISLEITKDDPRITRVGRFLRKTSLDEVPQLINILKGEMAFVGPRPLLPGTLKPEESRRQDLNPGITSYPALFGRHSLDWDYRMKLDLWYVDHWSLWLDFMIMFKTIPIVLSRENVYDPEGESKFRPGVTVESGETRER